MSDPCVIACLSGGLGNQLFMYAFAKALADRNQVPLKLDVTNGFVRDRTYKRRFILDQILPAEAIASRWESRAFPLGHLLRKFDRKFNVLLPLNKRYFIRERAWRFDREIYDLKIDRPTVFNGYWQAPQYFDDLTPDMASLFRLPEHVLTPIADELAVIRSEPNAVCLAIRRFEEVPNPKHHILQLEYFQAAMARIEQSIERPHYFVFTQDMKWAREHIRSSHPVTFAYGKDLHTGAVQDLYLMSQCRHYVISNSTLHWWAAWLNTSPDKLVIAPGKGWSNLDTIPRQWITLE